jgi:microcystin-dependent protein
VNSDFSDIADALTGSLARDGQGGMTGPLLLASQGVTYVSDPNTGLRRSAADTQEIFGGGLVQATIGPTGADFAVPLKQGGFDVLLVGEIKMFGGSTAPAGHLLCYGQAISRATYSALFVVLGTAYGVGDGSTTFNIPDLRGRAPFGKDDMGGVAAGRLTSATMTPDGTTLGATGGAQTVTVAQANLPNINFNVTGITLNDPGHSHSVGVAQQNAYAFGSNAAANFVGSISTTTVTTGVTVATQGFAQSGGSGTALTNMSPAIIANYIIFAGV